MKGGGAINCHREWYVQYEIICDTDLKDPLGESESKLTLKSRQATLYAPFQEINLYTIDFSIVTV